jgi:hypothetical protein
VARPKTTALSLDRATLLAYELLTPKVERGWVTISLEAPVSLDEVVCLSR